MIEFLSPDKWARVLAELPPDMQDVYWRSEFLAVSGERENAEPECLMLEKGSRRLIYPYLKHAIPDYDGPGSGGRFDVQTPYGYGGPLFSGDWSDLEKRDALMAVGEVLRRRGAVAEFIRCHTAWHQPNWLEASDYKVVRVRTNVECILDDERDGDFTKTWAELARRNLRKATSSGLSYRVIAISEGEQIFEQLYNLTFRRVGMGERYRFDRAYLGGLSRMSPKQAALIVVETTKPSAVAVASAIVFFGGRFAHYHLGGSDLSYRQQRPNDYLYWAMASEAQRLGCERIIWGGGLSNDPTDSLYRFKAHFGSVRTPVYIAGRVIDPLAYKYLCQQWQQRHPELAQTPQKFLLYRT